MKRNPFLLQDYSYFLRSSVAAFSSALLTLSVRAGSKELGRHTLLLEDIKRRESKELLADSNDLCYKSIYFEVRTAEDHFRKKKFSASVVMEHSHALKCA